MSEEELFDKVVAWFKLRSGLPEVIRDHQSGPRPNGPYGMVNMLSGDKVHYFPSETEYVIIPDATEEPMVAVPVLEWEWVFSLNVYAPGASDYMRKTIAAGSHQAGTEALLPFVVNRFSGVRRIPEEIEGKWEDRVQADIYIRGIARDGVPVDLIETVTVEVESQNGVRSSGTVTKPKETA